MQTKRYLISVTYASDNILTNFYSLIRSDPENTLFIYNDNVEQFIDKEDVTPGGGNGVMRMYRFDNPRNLTVSSGSLGIPTMFLKHSVVDDHDGFTQLLGYVHQALDQIQQFIQQNPRIENVVWSGDEQLMLGMSIAVRSQRISHTQSRTIQEVVRNRIMNIIHEHNMQIHMYGGPHTNLHSHDLIKRLHIRNVQHLL